MAIQNKTLDMYGFDQFVQNQQNIIKLERAINDIDDKINMVHEAIATNLMKTPVLVVKLGFVNSDIHNDAINICQRFKPLFNKYGLCHIKMNSTDACF